CRHDQHQRQTAPQKPPHDPLLSRLWPQHHPHDPHAVAHGADLEKDPSDFRESNCPSVRGWGSVDRHLSHIRSVLSAGWLSIQKGRVAERVSKSYASRGLSRPPCCTPSPSIISRRSLRAPEEFLTEASGSEAFSWRWTRDLRNDG